MNALQTIATPRFPRVPAEFNFRRDAINPRLAKFARILLDLGLITEADAPARGRANEQKLVERALVRWSAQVIGRPLDVFGDVFLCLGTDNAADLHESYGYNGEEAPDVDPEHCVLLSLSPWREGRTWFLEHRCLALEKRAPHLAEFALELVDYGAGRSVPVITPARAWDDFENRLSWNAEDEEDQAARKAFQGTMPEWAYLPERKLTQERLRELARKEPVAQTCIALLEAISDKKRARQDTGGHWHTVFGAVLRWSDDDLIERVTHDYVHDVQSGGEGTSDYSWHFVELQRKAVEQFFDGFGRMLRTLELTDRLISQLAEKA